MSERKQTVFDLCREHEWLRAEGRYRMAEFFCEGGPAQGGPCLDHRPCRIRPGTDLFAGELCTERDWYDTRTGPYPFVWGVNQ